jgi:hypothetical protein
MEHIGASPAISTDIGLIKIDSCRHPTTRAQPDQTVQGSETIDPDHGTARQANASLWHEKCCQAHQRQQSSQDISDIA